MGPVPMGVMGKSLFSNFDALTSNILLPTGAFLTSLVVGWVMPREAVVRQLESYGQDKWMPWAVSVFCFLVRFVCPLGIALTFLYQTGAVAL